MPSRDYHFWVYILSRRSRNLYTGITNNLIGRTATHRERVPGTYSARYAIHRLVYFEYFQYVRSAIAREKQLKHWTRAQKIELIERANPTWEDLYPRLLEPCGAGLKADSLRERQARKAKAETARIKDRQAIRNER
jgi:putative endonuclease